MRKGAVQCPLVCFMPCPEEAESLLAARCASAAEQAAGILIYRLRGGSVVCVGGVGKVNAAMAAPGADRPLGSGFGSSMWAVRAIGGFARGHADPGNGLCAAQCGFDPGRRSAGVDIYGKPGAFSLRGAVGNHDPAGKSGVCVYAWPPLPPATGSAGIMPGRGHAGNLRRAGVRNGGLRGGEVLLRNGVPFQAFKVVSDHLFADCQEAEYAGKLRQCHRPLERSCGGLSRLDGGITRWKRSQALPSESHYIAAGDVFVPAGRSGGYL